MKELLNQVQILSDLELKWSISNLEFIPVDKGDFIGGILSTEMEQLYNFQNRILDEHTIIIAHSDFMDLLKNIKSIYEGKFEVLLRGKQLKIKIFDGDIIEIDGDLENEISI